MELYATGFNAFNNLTFSSNPAEEPSDLFTFEKTLEGDNIELIHASLAYNVVRCDGVLRVTGLCSESERKFLDNFDTNSFACSGTGQVLATSPLSSSSSSKSTSSAPSNHISQYSSLSSSQTQCHDQRWDLKAPVKQIVAYEAGFMVLTENGRVFTLGDARYEPCLGREVSAQTPAYSPHEVPDLVSLDDKVMQISAAGYTLAALTESGSLYVWGMSHKGTHRREQAFLNLNGIPNYVEVADGQDIFRVALGESHCIVLTTQNEVYVTGRNYNGQLGLDVDINMDLPDVNKSIGGPGQLRLQDWRQLNLKLEDRKVVNIGAGPRCSLLVMAKR